MRKSQIKSKLDQKLSYITKNQAIKIEFLERLGDNNKQKDIKSEDDNALDLSDAQLYIHTVALICMR